MRLVMMIFILMGCPLVTAEKQLLRKGTDLLATKVTKDSILLGDMLFHGQQRSSKLEYFFGKDFEAQIRMQVKDTTTTETRHTRNLAGYNANPWPNAVVPYFIREDIVYPHTVQHVQKAMWEWQSQTCVKFISINNESVTFPWNHYTPNSFIDIGNEAYNQLDTFLCYSTVGLDVYNVMSLSALCEYGSVVHELGHTIGLLHEQSRPDRDKFVTVASAKKIDRILGKGWSLQFQKFAKKDWIGPETPFDYESLMAYPGLIYDERKQVLVASYKSKFNAWQPLSNRERTTLFDVSSVISVHQCKEQITISARAPYGASYVKSPNRRCAVFYAERNGICVFQKSAGTWDSFNNISSCRDPIKKFMSLEYCSEECPCEVGEGMCHSDDACVDDAECVNNICRFSPNVQNPVGAKCSFNYQCKSESCLSGRCCNSTIAVPHCDSCGLDGKCQSCVKGYSAFYDPVKGVSCKIQPGNECKVKYANDCTSSTCLFGHCCKDTNPLGCNSCAPITGDCLSCESPFKLMNGTCVKEKNSKRIELKTCPNKTANTQEECNTLYDQDSCSVLWNPRSETCEHLAPKVTFYTDTRRVQTRYLQSREISSQVCSIGSESVGYLTSLGRNCNQTVAVISYSFLGPFKITDSMANLARNHGIHPLAPVMGVNGELIASSWAKFMDPSVVFKRPVLADYNRFRVSSMWSGSDVYGDCDEEANCNDFTSEDARDLGNYGVMITQAKGAQSSFKFYARNTCDFPLRVSCLCVHN